MAEAQTSTPEQYKGRLAAGKDWTEIVAWVGDLPPLPHVAAQAIGLIEDPDTTAGQLTSLLGKDPALAARVLKIANSAMFSCQREITTLSQAIMIIGFKALKGIIVAATLRQLNRKFGPTERMIWENSTCTAVGAHLVCQRLRKSYSDEAFLYGLLHDLGKLVLMRQIPDQYREVVEASRQGIVYDKVEMEKLGFTHALIGALVAKKWNFPAEVCQIILHHHDPLEVPFENELYEKTAIVQFADLLAHELGFGHLEGYPSTNEELIKSGAALGFDAEAIAALTNESRDLFAQQASAFN